MKAPVAAGLDAVAVAAFAAVGRASHAESVGLVGIAETAWPFWSGALVGWAITRAWRNPGALSCGVGVWAGALVGGMALRWISGSGVQPAFVVVAGISLAVALLGWRAVARLAASSRVATG